MIVEEELKGVQKRISAEKNAIVEGRNWSQDLPQLLATWVATALSSSLPSRLRAKALLIIS